MYEPIQDAAARSRAMQFIDDLAGAADGSQEQQPGHLPLLRPALADYGWELVNHAGHPGTLNQMRGFINGLVVAQRLSPEQGLAFCRRLEEGEKTGWK